MPLIIAAVGIGLVTFYVKTKPEPAPVDPAMAEIEARGKPPVSIHQPVNEVLRAIPVTMVEDSAGSPSLPLLERDGVTSEDFTSWMSPLALDTYIRQKNRGFEKTFWERGHWIKAVEGRWNNGAHEFRIAFAANPDPDRVQWCYRIDQTEAQFTETLNRLRNEGYTLAQSHAYDHPDGSRRFQGVWQRTVPGSGRNNGPQDFIGAATGIH